MYPDKESRARQCRRKLDMCNGSAREAASQYRKTKDRRWSVLHEEAKSDAAYWRQELRKARAAH